MTRSEFESQRGVLACKDCGHVGLDSQFNTNNNGMRPCCPACKSVTPLAGISWLAKDSAKSRRPSNGITVAEVWEVNGNHCAYCGMPGWLCERLNVGKTMQHVLPHVFGAEGGPLIPFCARCQEASAARLKLTRDLVKFIPNDGEQNK